LQDSSPCDNVVADRICQAAEERLASFGVAGVRSESGDWSIPALVVASVGFAIAAIVAVAAPGAGSRALATCTQPCDQDRAQATERPRFNMSRIR
jgi:hypothetical protein